MNVQLAGRSVLDIEADAVVVGVWQGSGLEGAALELDKASGAVLSRLLASQDVTAQPLAIAQLWAIPGVKASSVVVVGLGERQSMSPQRAFQAAGAAARTLARRPRQRIAWFLDTGWPVESVCGAIVGCVGQDLYRAEKTTHPIETHLWAGVTDEMLQRGAILGQAVNLARRLVNQGPHDIYPESLAHTASQIGQAAGLDVAVWDERRLAEDRCGALLAVGSGSDRPPRIVRMRYRGGPESAAPLALVGKGVTFDSGGLSIKPPDSMTHMKYDMAGAAVVISAMQAISQLRLPVNVDGWIGLAENMINGRSYKLGDVLTARSGKTIEVLNTDAEGRLVLADVLDLAVTSGANHIVDLATLTGACVVALGRSVAGLMTNDQAWANAVMTAAARCGEPVWQLPMFDEFAEQIKSEVADIKNVGDSRWGGAITGAKFLEEFVQRRPWVHLDIAGPSFAEKPRAWIDAGASGAMVRTLVELAASIAPPTQSA